MKLSPLHMFASLWRNRELIFTMIKREVIGRYRGSILGILWSFFNPLFMLAVYTFVFSVVFKARWGDTGSDSKTEFALILFAGLIVFNLFQECVNKAPSLILSNVNFVKKVVFPLEILPWVSLGAAVFHMLVSLIVWTLFYIVLFGIPHATILFWPLIVIPLILFVMGVSWALAAIGVYLRDVSQFITIVTTVLLFVSPIFYPASRLPESYRVFIYLNPLTPAIELSRDVMFFGKEPNIMVLSIFFVFAMLIAWAGFAIFQKTREGFSDVL